MADCKKKESLLAQISGAVATTTYFSPKMCYRIYYRHRRCSGKWVSMVSDTFLSYVARNYVLIPYLPCYFISFILMKHKYITVKLQRLSRDTEYRNHCIICTFIHTPWYIFDVKLRYGWDSQVRVGRICNVRRYY